jgi:uncharacterized Zn finger protein
VDFICPSCSGPKCVDLARGERHYVRCEECGQIQLLLVRPLHSLNNNVVDLFPALDGEWTDRPDWLW